MNNTGCPPLYAYDTVFTRVPASDKCDLNIPLFVALLEFSACIHLATAIKKTSIILKNREKRQKAHKNEMTSWRAFLPFITLFQTWGSFLTCALTPLIWYLYTPSGFVLALEAFFFNLLCELWLAKLIRLGSRIIPAAAVSDLQSDSSDKEAATNSTNETKAIYEQLAQTDRPLELMRILSRSLLVVLFVGGVIVYPILGDEGEFFARFIIAMEFPLAVLYTAGMLWQYVRCEKAIMKTATVTKKMLFSSGNGGPIMVAVKKMRNHRYIVSFSAVPVLGLTVLFVAGVIPLRYWILIIAQIVDSFIAASMTFSLLRRSKKHSKQKNKPMPTDEEVTDKPQSPAINPGQSVSNLIVPSRLEAENSQQQQ